MGGITTGGKGDVTTARRLAFVTRLNVVVT